MPCDWNYYYDFEAEENIGKQAEISCENGRFVFECTFQCGKSDYYVLTQALPYAWQLKKYKLENIFLDGKLLGRADTVAYVNVGSARNAWKLFLEEGEHSVKVTGDNSWEESFLKDILQFRLLPALGKTYSVPDFSASCSL